MNSKRHRPILTALAVLVIVAAVLTLYNLIRLSSALTGQKGELYDPDSPPAQELALEAEQDVMSAGHTMLCRVSAVPENAGTKLSWSSSDSSVVSVEDGVLTAHIEGTAEITAVDLRSQLSASLAVSVRDDSLAETAAVIERLYVSYTDASCVDAVYAQRDILSRCSSAQAAEAGAGLDSFIRLADNSGQCDIGKLAALFGLSAGDVRLSAQTMRLRGQQSKSSVTISFAGDCGFGMLNETDTPDRFPSIYKASGSVTYPFDRVKHIFGTDDASVINFEGTLAKKDSPQASKNYHIRGEPEYTAILTGSSVEIAGLANNHTYDYYQEGFDRTDRLLTESSVNTIYESKPYITSINGIETVFLAGGDRIQPLRLGSVEEKLTSQIRQYKKKDNIVVVNVHWGDEYLTEPIADQISAAHRLIDEGADIIVGHHPHIIQGIEIYKGKVIAYSLGNFSFCGISNLREKETFILRASFIRDGDTAVMSEWSVVPCYATGTDSLSNDFRPVPLFGAQARGMIAVLEERSAALGNSQPIPYFYCD